MSLENIHTTFIQSFSSLTKSLQPMLLQFKSSIDYDSNVDLLRNLSVFNTLRENPESISSYASGKVRLYHHL